jgi:DNA-binding transcriptional regulator YiaG
MSKWESAEEFKSFIDERGISNIKVSILLGRSRDTVQKWLRAERVPVGVLDTLRGMDLTAYRFDRDFAVPMEMDGMSRDEFCALTGVAASELEKWKSDGFVPKWAVVILRQQRELKRLVKNEAKCSAGDKSVSSSGKIESGE